MNEEVFKPGSAALSGLMQSTITPAHDTALAAEQLDPGIADVVIRLRNLGFDTTDSGDGVTKPDEERVFDVKHVAYSVAEDKLFEEARRLHQVLGWGWKVEASFDPSAGGSCILLATKSEPPGPRHAAQVGDWEAAASGARLSELSGTIYMAGAGLYGALKHELGRR